jgi:hypothetical protein
MGKILIAMYSLNYYYHITHIMRTQNNSTPLKAMKTKELASSYGVSRKVFNTWLRPFAQEIGPKRGHYFTTLQVKIIVEKLGPYNLVGGILACLLCNC